LLVRWAKTFDKRKDRIYHSDFLRLILLAHRQEKEAYRTLLAQLQKRWPTWDKPPWPPIQNVLTRTTEQLFNIRNSSDNAFTNWVHGRTTAQAEQGQKKSSSE
jgi:hypothetical protein